MVESDKKRIVIDSSEEDTDHDAVTDLNENNDRVQNFIGKGGFLWQKLYSFQMQTSGLI